MNGLLSTFTHLLESYGSAALFAITALESLGAPLPGESAVIAASRRAAGELSITHVFLAALFGSILGDNIGYLIGRKLGRPAILRYGGRVGITEQALGRAEQIMRRRGPFVVVIARFIVLLRQLNGIVAGSTGMPWSHFLAANIVGATLWVGFWSTLAYRLGREADVLPWVWHHLGLIAAIVVPALILFLVATRFIWRKD